MLIDWFTVGAQVLNFAILVWLLKRFLYQPILNAIDAREKHIAKALAAADREKKEAAGQREEFTRKNADFERERAALVESARQAAKAERQTLMDAAREAADVLAATREAALADEIQALTRDLRECAASEVFAITRRTLRDLAGMDFESRACEIFVSRLRELDGQPRDALAAALSGSRAEVLVRSTFDLPDAQRQSIAEVVAEVCGAEHALRYATDPGFVAGIELIVEGQKLAWTISDYLASLERGVVDLLNTRFSKPTAAAP